tara:strand:- start:17144 stop:17473 length:330 start_codon:yes stop_codon:yes gene_type:complete
VNKYIMNYKESTGGLFWDVLLLSEYNEHWITFYESFIRVLPCEKCSKEHIHHHSKYPIPKISNNDEKNQFLWDLRCIRGSANYQDKIRKNEYTLETWLDQFKYKSFIKK